MNSLKKVNIILASGSASRRRQLEQLSCDFKLRVSGVDEDIYKSQKDSPYEICQTIAKAKAKKVASNHPEDLILAGDQMAVLDSEILNKTSEPEQAVQVLKKLQGKTHQLFTALYICYGNSSFRHLETNTMHMRPLTEQQIRKYVNRYKPLDCAGSYALERCGIGLFEKIETQDQSAIIGFPLVALINQLIRWEIPLPFL